MLRRRNIAQDPELGLPPDTRESKETKGRRGAVWGAVMLLMVVFVVLRGSRGEKRVVQSEEERRDSIAAPAEAGFLPSEWRKKAYQEQFWCSPHHAIPLGHVNDDYCDCTDGSDEPATGACSFQTHNAAVFHCTSGDTFVPSSLSHDGVCDCPDCSDE